MKLIASKTEELKGEITIPGSKSHTIRAVIFASLAEGTSKISNPLKSGDTMASVNACIALGAKINTENGNEWIIEGFNLKPTMPKDVLNMANSGTSTNLVSGIVAALCEEEITLDGDDSLRSRPMQPLLKALNNLGAEALSSDNNGKCPVKIKGKMTGGKTEVDGISSQFVSSLLIACPLLEEDTEIDVVNMHEKPYIEMTLKWLDEQGIKYNKNKELTKFKIKGKQKYRPFEKNIPADWSSAAFPMVAAAITKSDVLLKGLDTNDTQGDKAIINYLKKMGAGISTEENGIRIKGKELTGSELDLNATPDALPAMAVAGCFANGTTKLYNVRQARIKETDRIKVMHSELERMGADIREMDDGLIIHHSKLHGEKVKGHSDHRVVMALSLAGLIAEGKTTITTAESINVTFPNYLELMKSLGANIKMEGK